MPKPLTDCQEDDIISNESRGMGSSGFRKTMWRISYGDSVVGRNLSALPRRAVKDIRLGPEASFLKWFIP